MEQTEVLHEEISVKIYENVPEQTNATNIMSDINLLENYYIDKIREMQISLQNHLNTVNETVLKLEEAHNRAKRVDLHLKNLFIVRGYLNRQFRNYWRKYEDKISVSHEMLVSLSDRENIYDDIGYKFAVYILAHKEPIPELRNFSKDLCIFYIKINEKIHPKIYPLSVVVEAIRSLRSYTNETPIREFNVTDEILNEIEHTTT